ncbi:hypothetical protein CBR_g40734 [Chara braunii]|uniref:Integrase catalytic domain-containing protein n=1 Tax=Chara braunii TaxID=69332 RepID=A0A388LUI6_CHABU|nr:hypothetical protein CBR_g40734 [Chara braunii]|eukprot:GBG85921.1 hypothetical protein CBR_g40734 [Chara braunii]
MDGDIFDKWGKHIDPKVPGGIKQKVLRRAAAGPPVTPAMFRMWQEREHPAIRVEEIVGDSAEVTQRLKAGTMKEEPTVVEFDDEGQEGERQPVIVILEKVEDLLEKVGRYQQRLHTLCEEALRCEANLSEVFLYDSGPEPSSGQQGYPRVATVDLVIKNQKCTGMVDTGAEMNIIREKEAVMLGMEIDRSDYGMLHSANCKAAFCGTTSNVIIKIGKVRARTCFFVMPNVGHSILLGRSFLCRTEMLIFNKHDGTMILLLCDLACENYEVITCRNTGPGSGMNRPNLGSFTFEELENERRRLWEVLEEKDRDEVLTLSLTDVNKAMEVVSAHDMADPEAIKALREQVSENPQIDIIAALHDGIAGGHRGIGATCAKISELYHWDGMLTMVIKKYCQSCVPCQERLAQRPREPLHPRLEREVGAVVHMDLLFMPTGENGCNYIFDARDNLTGFVDGRAIQTKTDPVLANCIEEYYLRYPFVKEFVMDRGSEFTCNEVRTLLAGYGVMANYTTAAHPQANAPVERGHSTTTNLLAKWTEGKPGQWPKFLRAAFSSDFSKTAMQRGGRGARPRQRPLGASGGDDSHRPSGRESTPVFDDDNIELFLDAYQVHAAREGWSTLERIRHLRGVGRFEEPIAHIWEEALTWQDVEARMQMLRASPLGRDGLPIRLEEGNAEEFIPAYEQFMRDQGARQEEWMQTLPLWTRRAERPLARQIRDRAHDWEDCQAHDLRGPSPTLPEERETVPLGTPLDSLEAHLDASQWKTSQLGAGPGEPARYKPAEEPPEPEPKVGPHRPEEPRTEVVITVGDDTPLPTPILEQVPQYWPEGIPEPDSKEVLVPPLEATTPPPTRAELEGREESERAGTSTTVAPQLAKHAAEPLDTEMPTSEEPPPELPHAEKGVNAGVRGTQAERPPKETVVEKFARVQVRLEEIYQEKIRMEAAGEAPKPPIDPPTSEQRIGEAWASYEGKRDATRSRSREAGQEDEREDETRETGDLGFSATRTERTHRRIREVAITSFQLYSMLSDELAASRLEVEQLSTQLAGERAENPAWRSRMEAKEVEWETRLQDMAAIVERLSATKVVDWTEQSRYGIQGKEVQGLFGQGGAAEPSQQEGMEEATPMAVEIPIEGPAQSSQPPLAEGGPTEESPTILLEVQEGTLTGAAASTEPEAMEEEASRLDELVAAMELDMPSEGPQRHKTPERVPEIGELRTQLGSWATGADSEEHISEQQQKVMSKPVATVTPQPSDPHRGEGTTVMERVREGRPQRFDTPAYRPEGGEMRAGPSTPMLEARPTESWSMPQSHEVSREASEMSSLPESQKKKMRCQRR